MNSKNILIVAAFVVLAVVAAMGWTRSREPQAVSPALSAQPADYTPGAGYNAGAAQPANDPSTYAPEGPGPYEPVIPRPVVVRAPEPVPQAAPAPPAEAAAGPAPAEAPAPRAAYREVHHRRSTGQSVAIVAGSAGVGAAIGALAGGGKGAGIGALAGGAGGFAYDRLTHNH